MPRLGQHFLKNTAAMKKIVEALALKSDDTVIEIGPGHGELTSELRNKNQEARIIAIEKDDELCKSLEMKIGEGKMKNIEVIHGYALKILSSLIRKLSARDGSTFGGKSENFKLTGNIPYYITGKLLRLMSELKEKPERCVFMVQKEVAERIAATPPRMNRLAAMVQFWMIPETIMTLGKESFSPPPTVDSAGHSPARHAPPAAR